MSEIIKHTLAPVFNDQSGILILGSLPSPLSQKRDFITGTRRIVSGASWERFFLKKHRRATRIPSFNKSCQLCRLYI